MNVTTTKSVKSQAIEAIALRLSNDAKFAAHCLYDDEHVDISDATTILATINAIERHSRAIVDKLRRDVVENLLANDE